MTQYTGTTAANGQSCRITLAPTQDKALVLPQMEIGPGEALVDEGRATRYEYHPRHDYLSVQIPHKSHLAKKGIHLEVYLTQNDMAAFCDDGDFLAQLSEGVARMPQEELAPDKVLYTLFGITLSADTKFLETFEDEIARMEEQTIRKQPKDFTHRLIELRKRLLIFKRYYESLFDLLEDLEENQNGFISKPMLRNFRLHTNRVDRLSHLVLDLRDYLTQVREAYQNQIDIHQNQIMQLFTVITVIFLPLTLIVGWYGMNLQMPEFGWPYTYPVVVVVSVLIVVLCLRYFKKKNWF